MEYASIMSVALGGPFKIRLVGIPTFFNHTFNHTFLHVACACVPRRPCGVHELRGQAVRLHALLAV